MEPHRTLWRDGKLCLNCGYNVIVMLVNTAVTVSNKFVLLSLAVLINWLDIFFFFSLMQLHLTILKSLFSAFEDILKVTTRMEQIKNRLF